MIQDLYVPAIITVSLSPLVSVPVAWGDIRGKAWGCDSRQPVLAVHGWLDNAGSYDNLAPLLSNGTVM